MRISNKFLPSLFLLFSVNSFSGTLYYFDGADIVGFEEGGKISGSYSAQAHANGQSFACEFNFKTADQGKNSEKRKIAAEEKNEKSVEKAEGYLYVSDDDWRIQINFPSEGCKRFPWPVFSSNKKVASSFSVSEKKAAIGIFLLNNNTSYYGETGGNFEPLDPRGNRLAKGNIVAAIKKKGDFTYVERFSSTSRSVASSGWIKSADLGDSISR